MEAFQMLKYLVKQGHSINFTVGSPWEDERAAIEKLMVIDGDVPENLKAYQEFLVHPRVQTDDSDIENS